MTSLHDSVDKFVSEHLLATPVECSKSKFFHDSLWGTVELYPHELCIVDTPLFLFFRQIHQTGNVFATFPSATHTRFEHSIGVLHVASRIVEQLRQKFKSTVTDKSRLCVRLAGLCHDLGHSAFSHTSEEYYSQAEDLAPLLQPGGEFEGKGGGEVLSYLILTSPSFLTFFKSLKDQSPDLPVDIEVKDFAPLVLGRKVDPSRQYEADIISGPFDADKLDYFPRDGRASGIEMALDIGRLLHTMGIGKVKGQISKEDTYSLIVTAGGYNSIQQLLFARATLFSAMYHHHKVRACDCMVKACYEHFIATKTKFRTRTKRDGVSLESAADFLYFTDLDFFSEAHQHGTESPEHQLIHDLLYRRLLKRVLTISSNTVKCLDRSSKAEGDEEVKLQRAAYSHFINLRNQAPILRRYAKKIARDANLLDEQSRVWFDIPQPPSFSKAGGALINVASRSSGECNVRPLSEFIPIEEWVRTYEQYHSKSYLFGPNNPKMRVALAVSAINLFQQELKLQLKRDAIQNDIRDEVIAKFPSGTFD